MRASLRLEGCGLRRVLLIEDEPAVRQVFTAAFQRLNFEIVTAGSCVRPPDIAGCAFECCCVQCARPDLAVIAVVAPRSCSGLDTAQKALTLWPTLKVLLTSASPMELWPEYVRRKFEMLPTQSYTFLPKPFTSGQLFKAVRELLGDPARDLVG